MAPSRHSITQSRRRVADIKEPVRKAMYTPGDNVWCEWNQIYYKAKILETGIENNGQYYLVHYWKFSKNWDTTISDRKIFPMTPENNKWALKANKIKKNELREKKKHQNKIKLLLAQFKGKPPKASPPYLVLDRININDKSVSVNEDGGVCPSTKDNNESYSITNLKEENQHLNETDYVAATSILEEHVKLNNQIINNDDNSNINESYSMSASYSMLNYATESVINCCVENAISMKESKLVNDKKAISNDYEVQNISVKKHNLLETTNAMIDESNPQTKLDKEKHSLIDGEVISCAKEMNPAEAEKNHCITNVGDESQYLSVTSILKEQAKLTNQIISSEDDPVGDKLSGAEHNSLDSMNISSYKPSDNTSPADSEDKNSNECADHDSISDAESGSKCTSNNIKLTDPDIDINLNECAENNTLNDTAICLYESTVNNIHQADSDIDTNLNSDAEHNFLNAAESSSTESRTNNMNNITPADSDIETNLNECAERNNSLNAAESGSYELIVNNINTADSDIDTNLNGGMIWKSLDAMESGSNQSAANTIISLADIETNLNECVEGNYLNAASTSYEYIANNIIAANPDFETNLNEGGMVKMDSSYMKNHTMLQTWSNVITNIVVNNYSINLLSIEKEELQIKEVKNKWENIPTSTAQSNNIQSGSAAKAIKKHSDMLSFLQPVSKKRKTTGNISVPSIADACDTVEDENNLLDVISKRPEETIDNKSFLLSFLPMMNMVANENRYLVGKLISLIIQCFIATTS